MAYAYIENNEITEVQFLLPRNWRNISNFDTLTLEDLNNLGWYEIVDEIPVYDADTTEVYDTVLSIGTGVVKRIYLTRPKEVVEVVVDSTVTETPPE